VPDLVAVLDEVLERPGLALLVLDLSEVAFLGSSGLGVLADLTTRADTAPLPPAERTRSQPAAERTRPGPALRVVAPVDRYAVVRPWETMNLHHILPLYPTTAAAIAALG